MTEGFFSEEGNVLVMSFGMSEPRIPDDEGVEIVIDNYDESGRTCQHMTVEEGIGENLQERVEFVCHEYARRGESTAESEIPRKRQSFPPLVLRRDFKAVIEERPAAVDYR